MFESGVVVGLVYRRQEDDVVFRSYLIGVPCLPSLSGLHSLSEL